MISQLVVAAPFFFSTPCPVDRSHQLTEVMGNAQRWGEASERVWTLTTFLIPDNV
jgi:hypothetical protein